MNAKHVLFQAFFYSALALAIGACASFPPQLRPTDPSPFIGEWEGFWDSNSGSRGGLNTKINPPDAATGRIIIHTIISNAVVPSFSIPTKLVNGELILRSTTLDMTFRFHGDQIVAEYDNKRINDKGAWHLKRKK